MKTKAVAEAKPGVVSRKKRPRPASGKRSTRRRTPALPYRTVIEAFLYDEKWVKENLDKLLAEWGHVFLAVKDQEVFDTDPDRNTLIARLRQKYGMQGFLVISLDDPTLRGEEDNLQLWYDGAIDEQDLELPLP